MIPQLTTAVIFLAAISLHAQAASTPAFEVAAIHPTPPDKGATWVGNQLTPSGHFLASKVYLSGLVQQAYSSGVNIGEAPSKVALNHDAPKWIDSEEFDIDAKIDDAYLQGWGNLSYRQRMDIVRPMLRQLLADRFHVKFHTEMRPTPVYALVQAKSGAHVKEVVVPPGGEDGLGVDFDQWVRDNPGKTPPGVLMCGGDGKCKASAVKFSMAVDQIGFSAGADRLVIDDTGLKGYYEFSFTMPHDPNQPGMREIEQDLGMRFESRTVPIKTYVIESADKPSVD